MDTLKDLLSAMALTAFVCGYVVWMPIIAEALKVMK